MIFDQLFEQKIKVYAFVGPSRNWEKLSSSNGCERKRHSIYN